MNAVFYFLSSEMMMKKKCNEKLNQDNPFDRASAGDLGKVLRKECAFYFPSSILYQSADNLKRFCDVFGLYYVRTEGKIHETYL